MRRFVRRFFRGFGGAFVFGGGLVRGVFRGFRFGGGGVVGGVEARPCRLAARLQGDGQRYAVEGLEHGGGIAGAGGRPLGGGGYFVEAHERERAAQIVEGQRRAQGRALGHFRQFERFLAGVRFEDLEPFAVAGVGDGHAAHAVAVEAHDEGVHPVPGRGAEIERAARQPCSGVVAAADIDLVRSAAAGIADRERGDGFRVSGAEAEPRAGAVFGAGFGEAEPAVAFGVGGFGLDQPQFAERDQGLFHLVEIGGEIRQRRDGPARAVEPQCEFAFRSGEIDPVDVVDAVHQAGQGQGVDGYALGRRLARHRGGDGDGGDGRRDGGEDENVLARHRAFPWR